LLTLTKPAWMYTGGWSYPKSPTEVDWSYSDGKMPYSNTTSNLQAYYARLISWIVHGYFVDEFGRNYTGGPAIGARFNHWELFNVSVIVILM
jgi:hypothetical protein